MTFIKPTSVGVPSRAQKVKDPATSGMVNGAKSNQTKRILKHVWHAVCAIVLNPALHAAAATACAAALVLLGGHHGL